MLSDCWIFWFSSDFGKRLKYRTKPRSQSYSPPCSECASSPAQSPADPSALKLELLADLHKDIADILKTDLHAALRDDSSTIKVELQAVKTQLSNDRAATQAEQGSFKGTVVEMEPALSTCTYDIISIQNKISQLICLSWKINARTWRLDRSEIISGLGGSLRKWLITPPWQSR